MEKILILNPGSTSTKIAVFEDEHPLFVKNIEHSPADLAPFEKLSDQYEYRMQLVLGTLEKESVKVSDLTAVVARGGSLPPVESGAYAVNGDMVRQLIEAPVNQHASSLAALIAYDIAQKQGIPAYIYDCTSTNELLPVMKICGHPDFVRSSMGHHLNMRAAARRYALENDKQYTETAVIVAHLGGGISVGLIDGGRMVDILNDENGFAFSPERSGSLPAPQVVEAAFSGKYDRAGLLRLMKSKGGLLAHLGTNDSREVEKRIAAGDEQAELVYRAMALNVAKAVGAEAALAAGKVDAVILTGGIAYSELFTGMIRKQVEFLAPVIVYAGENEMESLALGGLRVLRGEEEAKEFKAVIHS